MNKPTRTLFAASAIVLLGPNFVWGQDASSNTEENKGPGNSVYSSEQINKNSTIDESTQSNTTEAQKVDSGETEPQPARTKTKKNKKSPQQEQKVK